MSARICYLIQAYSDYEAFKALCNTLLKNSECHIFVHVDKKSDIDLFFIESSKVHFISHRELVSWAGYKQGKLIMNLIEEALEFKIKFDYYCFISESDYPVYTGETLINKIINTRNIFLNCSRLQPNKVQKYWIYDFGIKSPKVNKYLSHLVNGITEILYQCHLLRKNKKVLINGEMCEVYFSSPFWKYSYEEMTCINNTFKENPQLEKYFKYSFAPCELIVATIVANSKYRNNVDYVDNYINLNQLSSFCYFRYDGPRVNVLTIDDYESIVASNKPFMRKIKNEVSDSLIKKLELYCENEYLRR